MWVSSLFNMGEGGGDEACLHQPFLIHTETKMLARSFILKHTNFDKKTIL